MKLISFDCPACASFQTLRLESDQKSLTLPCGHCAHELHLEGLNEDPLNHCPVCQNKELHQHKDFNKKLGIAIFLLGAVFAPWTYYLSLVGALILDALLYPFFPWMQVCYYCKSELRGWQKNEKLDRFNHETAAHYEYGKNKWIDKSLSQ